MLNDAIEFIRIVNIRLSQRGISLKKLNDAIEFINILECVNR